MRAAQDVAATYLYVKDLRTKHRQEAKKANEETMKIKADYEALLVEKRVVERCVNELTTDLDSKAQ